MLSSSFPKERKEFITGLLSSINHYRLIAEKTVMEDMIGVIMRILSLV